MIAAFSFMQQQDIYFNNKVFKWTQIIRWYLEKFNQKRLNSFITYLLDGLSQKAKKFFHLHPFNEKTMKNICSSKKDHYYVLLSDNKIIGYCFLRIFGYQIPSFGCCIRNEIQGKVYGYKITKLC